MKSVNTERLDLGFRAVKTNSHQTSISLKKRGRIILLIIKPVIFKVCSLRTKASASPENVLEMQILRSCPIPIESGTIGAGPSYLYFDMLSR